MKNFMMWFLNLFFAGLLIAMTVAYMKQAEVVAQAEEKIDKLDAYIIKVKGNSEQAEAELSKLRQRSNAATQ